MKLYLIQYIPLNPIYENSGELMQVTCGNTITRRLLWEGKFNESLMDKIEKKYDSLCYFNELIGFKFEWII